MAADISQADGNSSVVRECQTLESDEIQGDSRGQRIPLDDSNCRLELDTVSDKGHCLTIFFQVFVFLSCSHFNKSKM